MLLYIEREIHVCIYIYTYVDIFFLSVLFSSMLCIVAIKKEKRWRVLFFSPFVIYKTRKSFALRDLAWRCYCRRHHHHRRRYDDMYVYIFSFQLLLLPLPWLWWCVQVCYSLLSFSFFFSSFFFRFDWRSQWWMLYAVSLSLFPSCSVTIHFTRVLLCLSYSAPSCSVSMHAICIFLEQCKRVSRHIICIQVKEIL
jgi:hypothetical protein